MGKLVNGRWIDSDDTIVDGAFKRTPDQVSQKHLLDQLSNAGVSAGRFILIGSLSCPWSHRALIVHALKGLGELIPVHFAGGRRDQGYSINQIGRAHV